MQNTQAQEKFRLLSAAVLRAVEVFAAARKARKACIAERNAKMSAWHAWQKAEHSRIDAEVDRNTALILGAENPLPALLAAEQAAEATAAAYFGGAWAARKALVLAGLELEDLPLPPGVSASVRIVGNIVAPDLVPASLHSPDADKINAALQAGDVPGVQKAHKVSFTVRDPR